jgi:hypothetical protein
MVPRPAAHALRIAAADEDGEAQRKKHGNASTADPARANNSRTAGSGRSAQEESAMNDAILTPDGPQKVNCKKVVAFYAAKPAPKPAEPTPTGQHTISQEDMIEMRLLWDDWRQAQTGADDAKRELEKKVAYITAGLAKGWPVEAGPCHYIETATVLLVDGFQMPLPRASNAVPNPETQG